MSRLTVLLYAFLFLTAVVSCLESDDSCTKGTEGCDCTSAGMCGPGLECLSGKCVISSDDEDEEDGGPDSGGETDTDVDTDGDTDDDTDDDTDSDSDSDCLSGTHQEPKCSDCEGWEYCEEGSSSSGVYCLQPCDIDEQCCDPLECVTNKWVYSYQGTICSDDGF